VEVFLPNDRATGRPRGFAFVEFESQDSVAKAIETFDGYELKGRALRVNEAQERPPRAPRFSSEGGRGGDRGGYDSRPSRPKGSRKGARGKKRSL
jgi:RNA recognition motif-containing protein